MPSPVRVVEFLVTPICRMSSARWVFEWCFGKSKLLPSVIVRSWVGHQLQKYIVSVLADLRVLLVREQILFHSLQAIRRHDLHACHDAVPKVCSNGQDNNALLAKEIADAWKDTLRGDEHKISLNIRSYYL
jgi:hypothetical protein